MARFRTEMVVPAPVERVWAFHADVGNLVRVIPKNLKPHLLKLHERFEPGAEFVLRIGWGYWWTQWHGRLVEVEPPRRFTDEQIFGPFAQFSHEHRFEPVGNAHTRITETLDYRLRREWLGWLGDLLVVRWKIRGVIGYRRRVLARELHA